MGLFEDLLEKKSCDISKKLVNKKKTIILFSRSDAYLATIISQIDLIFKKEQESVDGDVGVGHSAPVGDYDDDNKKRLQVYHGTVGFFMFEGAMMSLNLYTLSPINGKEICNTIFHGITETCSVYFVVDGHQLHKDLEARTADGHKIHDTVLELVNEWKNDMRQFTGFNQIGSFGFIIGGYDSIEYSFKTMKAIDLVQQVLRTIVIEENKLLGNSGGMVVYLKNMGADVDRVAQFLEMGNTDIHKKIEIADYSSMFVPTIFDDKDSIMLVDDSFNYEYWASQWKDLPDVKNYPSETEKKLKDASKNNISDIPENIPRMVFEQHQAFLRGQLNNGKKIQIEKTASR